MNCESCGHPDRPDCHVDRVAIVTNGTVQNRVDVVCEGCKARGLSAWRHAMAPRGMAAA